ncbi:protein lifeguard 1-like [Dermacentor silvarum]|uniref:protein lifeguard 1-like n=1 Tax=Dermacentor silvarum TaxID=543639 RepID=UPI002101CA6D|nr:protein lifeguard 1-like [Dermacentor silvarum]
MMAAGITATVFILLTIFAMQTAIDFTVYTGVAFVFLILLMIFGLVAMLFPTRLLQMVYACAGAGLFSFYILIDTQLIMGGESRACQISPEDYITGALMLYLDIMNLFVYILQILRQLNGDD